MRWAMLEPSLANSGMDSSHSLLVKKSMNVEAMSALPVQQLLQTLREAFNLSMICVPP